MANLSFRVYCKDDFNACIDIFDSNCPEYLAPHEREDYEAFLREAPQGYRVCEVDGQVIGVFGLSGDGDAERRLDWIMVNTRSQGLGIGDKIMQCALDLGRESNASTLGLSTTQKIAPFFEKYGAATISVTKDGYGSGLDQVDMLIPLRTQA